MNFTFRQWMRIFIALPIVFVWLGVFVMFGRNVMALELDDLAPTVTALGLYLAIAGNVVDRVINFLFNEDKENRA